MSDATRIEQRLHDLFASWRRRQGPDPGDRESAREMEQQAVKRLFADRHRNQAPAYAHDVKAAREMERQAIERLYGGRSTVVVEAKREAGNEDS